MTVIENLLNYKGRELRRYQSSLSFKKELSVYKLDEKDMKKIVNFIIKEGNLKRTKIFIESIGMERFSDNAKKIMLIAGMLSGRKEILKYFINEHCLSDGCLSVPLRFMMKKTMIESCKVSFKDNLFFLTSFLNDNDKSKFLEAMSEYNFKTVDFIAIKEKLPGFLDDETVKVKFLNLILFKKIIMDESVERYIKSDSLCLDDFISLLDERLNDLGEKCSFLACMSLKSKSFFKDINEFEKIIKKESGYICSYYPKNKSLAMIIQHFLDNMNEKEQLNLVALIAKKINNEIDRHLGSVSAASYRFTSPFSIDKTITGFLLQKNKNYISANEQPDGLSKRYISGKQLSDIQLFYVKLISRMEKYIINISLEKEKDISIRKEIKRL